LAKEKKIKVEADVTIRKNVSSGIGKGFGMVIGVVLALIVIAVFFGIIISSNADEIEQSFSQLSQDTRKFQEELQKIREPIQQSYPPPERLKQNDKEFKFSPDSIVENLNGVSLSIDNIDYILKGGTWGQVVAIEFTIFNELHSSFYPGVFVSVHDEGDREQEWYRPDVSFKLENSLNKGKYVSMRGIATIGFNDLNLSKKIRVVVTDQFDYRSQPIVFVGNEFVANQENAITLEEHEAKNKDIMAESQNSDSNLLAQISIVQDDYNDIMKDAQKDFENTMNDIQNQMKDLTEQFG